MARVKKNIASSFLRRELPQALLARVLPGAARAMATVVADEAKDTVISDEVRGAIKVEVSRREGRIVAKVQVKGPGAYIAPWLEYGTDPHFISVAPELREGRSVRRINELVGEGSLVIGGNFVGQTVHHPGARPHPFLRPALDRKEGEAIAAGQAHIARRLTKAGLTAPDEDDQ